MKTTAILVCAATALALLSASASTVDSSLVQSGWPVACSTNSVSAATASAEAIGSRVSVSTTFPVFRRVPMEGSVILFR